MIDIQLVSYSLALTRFPVSQKTSSKSMLFYRVINRGRVQFGRKSHAELNEQSEFNLSSIFNELYDSPVYYPIITWLVAN